jgi:hypothetical protein
MGKPTFLVLGRQKGDSMSQPGITESWVVYRKSIHKKASAIFAVCEQVEWDAMERASPGHHTLIRAGIANEGEAERFARSGPSSTPPV